MHLKHGFKSSLSPVDLMLGKRGFSSLIRIVCFLFLSEMLKKASNFIEILKFLAQISKKEYLTVLTRLHSARSFLLLLEDLLATKDWIESAYKVSSECDPWTLNSHNEACVKNVQHFWLILLK